jgi:hypothetical protein
MATDDEINELIMRSESELEMWSAMDQQRLAQESALPSAKALPRLMQVSLCLSTSSFPPLPRYGQSLSLSPSLSLSVPGQKEERGKTSR